MITLFSRPNKSCFVLIALLLFSSRLSLTAKQSGVDWIFLIDTSQSMRGVGGGKNIFQKVKEAVGDFVLESQTGDSITIYTFDRDVTPRVQTLIESDLDKQDLAEVVSSLRADGIRTYTGLAIQKGLERTQDLRRRHHSEQRSVALVIFTDGVEDVRGIPHPTSIPSNVQLLPKNAPFPFIFYVSLGEHDQELDRFVNDPALHQHGKVIQDSEAGRIKEVGREIPADIGGGTYSAIEDPNKRGTSDC
jgi:hypothetical protein